MKWMMGVWFVGAVATVGAYAAEAPTRARELATEEAVVNALVAARTMTGADGYKYFELPHDPLRAILKRYGR